MVVYEIKSSIGQLVARGVLNPKGNLIDQEIKLSQSLSKGLYLMLINKREATELIKFNLIK